MLLRQSKHLCVEAGYTVVNKWEFSLARRPAGVTWHGSNPCGLIFSIPQKSSCIPCCLLAVVPGLHQPLNCAQTLSGKNETLGTGQNCATHRASSSPAWVIAGRVIVQVYLLVLLRFPKQAAVLYAQPHVKLYMHNFIDCKTRKE